MAKAKSSDSDSLPTTGPGSRGSTKTKDPPSSFSLSPSSQSSLLYLSATFISSVVLMGILTIIAPKNEYEYDNESCTCDCFDRRFKDLHFDAKDQYRHVYFNITSSTALIFLWSAFHFALLVAFVQRTLACLCESFRWGHKRRPGKLRWAILACAGVNFYGLIYGWWCILNYINDAHHWSDMGVFWPTQLFFSLTDLVPAHAIYSLLATGSAPSDAFLQCAFVVSATHVLLALWDQGAVHILTQHHLAARDMMFLISDMAGIFAVIPNMELKSMHGKENIVIGITFLSLFYLVLKVSVGSR